MGGLTNRLRRKRKTLSLTLDPMVANKVEEMAKERKIPKSRLVEMVISLGAARFERLHDKPAKVVKEEVGESVVPAPDTKTKGERLAEAYMRRKLFSSDERDWAPI